MHISYESILVASLALTCQAAKSRPSNAVLLSEVEALTFYAGKKTSHRRVSAVPQVRHARGVAPIHLTTSSYHVSAARERVSTRST